MKTTELMHALEAARPDMLEAAAPSVQAESRPDVSGVLRRIRGEQHGAEVRVPALTIRQTKRPRLITAMLTACSVAACAAVVTGLAFLIRNTGDTVEMSSNVAVQFASETASPEKEPEVEPVSGQTAALQMVYTALSEPVPGESLTEAKHTAKTEPVTGTVQSDAQPAPKAESPSSDTEAPAVTAKTVPTAAARQQNDETIVRITYKIPHLSISNEDMFHIELFDNKNNKKISGFDLYSGEPGGDSGIVEVVIPDGTTHFTAILYNDENHTNAEIGTFAVVIQNGTVQPIKMHIDSALSAICTAEPAQTVPLLHTTENSQTLPAPSFVYRWNSDQYSTLDPALHHESAAAWKNLRMMDGDWALYAGNSDGFRWLDEHADSAHYLWFMYEADGYVPEVRRVEITENGIRIEAALVPADVQGKVRVMIPLNAETPASWFADSADQWQLSISGTISRATEKPAEVNWTWYVD